MPQKQPAAQEAHLRRCAGQRRCTTANLVGSPVTAAPQPATWHSTVTTRLPDGGRASFGCHSLSAAPVGAPGARAGLCGLWGAALGPLHSLETGPVAVSWAGALSTSPGRDPDPPSLSADVSAELRRRLQRLVATCAREAAFARASRTWAHAAQRPRGGRQQAAVPRGHAPRDAGPTRSPHSPTRAPRQSRPCRRQSALPSGRTAEPGVADAPHHFPPSCPRHRSPRPPHARRPAAAGGAATAASGSPTSGRGRACPLQPKLGTNLSHVFSY